MSEGNTYWSQATVIALAEALRAPLLQLKAGAYQGSDQSIMQIVADNALRDVEAFITSVADLADSQLYLQPIALGAVMRDVQSLVKPFAVLHRATIIIDDHAMHQPILGNAHILRSSLELLVKSVCEMTSDTVAPKVVLRADTRHGYPRLGVYRNDVELRSDDVRMAQKLLGGARVNAGAFHQLGALRLEVARQLLSKLDIRLRSAQSAGSHGLAIQLLPSTQVGLF
jgi:hypothetical protein